MIFKMETTNYLEIELGNKKYFVVDNGKRIRKQDINQVKGDIPVYSSSKYKNETLGFVSDEIKKIVPKAKKFSGKCITINADATDYNAFMREEDFYANDVLNVIKIINEEIDVNYVAFKLKELLKTMGLSWHNKLYKEKLKKIKIPIPINNKGKIDLEKQKQYADKCRKIEQLKNNITSIYDEIQNQMVNLESSFKYKEVEITELFDFVSGDSKYTKKYVSMNQGEFPIYSANTKENGLFGHINSYDHDRECIQLTTNGVYAGTLFFREKHKFSINGDARLMIKKYENLDYSFLLMELKLTFSEFNFNWENKPTMEKMNGIKIKIPIKKDGSYDLAKQKEIANKFFSINKVKKSISDDYNEIMQQQVLIEI